MRPVLPAGMTQPAAQGGRTSTRVHTVVQPPWGRRRQRPAARRCAGRSPSMYGMFDPLGADDDGRATLRGFAALTHGYRVVRPLRGRLPGEAVRDAAHGTTMCRPCGMRPTARRCAVRSPSMYGMFDPLGADDDGRATLRGFAALTHGYRVVRPLRGRLPGEAVRDAVHGTTMCRPCGDAARDTTMCRAGMRPHGGRTTL